MPATTAAAPMTVRLPVKIKTWPLGYGTEEMGITMKWYYSAVVMGMEIADNAGRGLDTEAAAEKAARKAVREWARKQVGN